MANKSFNTSDPFSCNWPTEKNFLSTLDHFPELWATIIFRPILIGLGTIGSLLIFTVQMREIKKTSTTVYLTIMSLSSIIIMWSNFPSYVLTVWSGSMDSEVAWQTRPDWHKIRGLTEWLESTAIWITDCTLVIFSVERLLCTMKPLRFLNMFTVKRALLFELGIATLSGLVNSITLVLYYSEGLKTLIVIWYEATLKLDCARIVCTWLILMVTNITLVRLISTLAEARQSLVANRGNGSPSSSGGLETGASTILLLCSALIYSAAQFPWMIYQVLTQLELPPVCWIQLSKRTTVLCFIFAALLSLFGYAVDFYVYYIFSASFRRQMNSLCARSARHARGHAVHSAITHTTTAI
ncbi:hypothetical protein BV898_15778 [Hypsibius exemplaris]|uniref:G-protein coupled receptors family 1 profile domain-containing protein n=1 Tax=Hypsibius exemplaris TaxID=2072580 RepID=A0A9X6NBW6_HYPEX|nr:hypothetical protein BV898_15778 [Hypsibius exemplaris]